jgi:hypothetical protein
MRFNLDLVFQWTSFSFSIQIYAFPPHFLTAVGGALIKLRGASVTPDATHRTAGVP